MAYAGLSHYCNSVSTAPDLGTALALGPVTLLACILAWRWGPAALALLLWSAVAAAVYALWPVLRHNFPLIYLIEEGGIYGLLGATFGRSLLQGRIAVCTLLADKVHGPLAPCEVLYTRRVTAAWALFFFTVAGVSLLLYLLAPLKVWSLYVNFCVLPLVGAMFVAEYLVRQRALPRGARAGLLATVRVYLATPPVS